MLINFRAVLEQKKSFELRKNITIMSESLYVKLFTLSKQSTDIGFPDIQNNVCNPINFHGHNKMKTQYRSGLTKRTEEKSCSCTHR